MAHSTGRFLFRAVYTLRTGLREALRAELPSNVALVTPSGHLLRPSMRGEAGPTQSEHEASVPRQLGPPPCAQLRDSSTAPTLVAETRASHRRRPNNTLRGHRTTGTSLIDCAVANHRASQVPPQRESRLLPSPSHAALQGAHFNSP